jgi:serine/threonine protein kinase
MLSISAAAFGRQITVDPLVTLNLASQMTEIPSFIPIFAALRLAITELQAYYSQIPFENVLQDQRRFPYFCAFGTKHLSYQYGLVQGDDCLVFHAILEPDNQQVVVKFAKQYGEEAHRVCALLGIAPALYHHEILPGDWTVVVMEYVSGGFKELWDCPHAERKGLRPAIESAVSKMHNAGYVHGDLHRANVLCNINEKIVKFIDWDWAGKPGEAKYPLTINRGVPRHGTVRPLGPVLVEHDIASVESVVCMGMSRYCISVQSLTDCKLARRRNHTRILVDARSRLYDTMSKRAALLCSNHHLASSR